MPFIAGKWVTDASKNGPTQIHASHTENEGSPKQRTTWPALHKLPTHTHMRCLQPSGHHLYVLLLACHVGTKIAAGSATFLSWTRLRPWPIQAREVRKQLCWAPKNAKNTTVGNKASAVIVVCALATYFGKSLTLKGNPANFGFGGGPNVPVSKGIAMALIGPIMSDGKGK